MGGRAGTSKTFAFPYINEEMAMKTTIDPCISRRYRRHGMLPQLAAFEAVVRLGSATRAAEALCVAQPTLSGHLRKLSEALGVCLFEPRGRGLVPTDAALVLLQATREVSTALARCEDSLVQLRMRASTQAALDARYDPPVQDAGFGVAIAGHPAPASATTART
ncbi:MAG: LysR family transcriptional regulator [Burkholderiaceae bacterium]